MKDLTGNNFLLNALWFVRLRWIAIATVVIAAISASLIINVEINSSAIYFSAGVLLMLNFGYLFFIKYFQKRNFQATDYFRIILNIQVALDFVMLTLILHFSGGIENPFIIFYIFHMILGSLILPRLDSYLQTTLALLLFIALNSLENTGVISHYTLNKNISNLIFTDKAYLFSAFAIFAFTSYMVIFLTTRVAQRLRDRELALERLNAELALKDKIKDEYVQRVTHDIKGHLSAVQTNLEVVEKKIYGNIDERYDKFVGIISKRLLNLSNFIEDLLILTRLRLEKRRATEVFDITELLDKIPLEHDHNLKKKNLKVELDLPSKILNVKANQLAMGEVLNNLMSNAVKYSQEGGVIQVSARLFKEKYVLVKIRDAGIGVSSDDLPNIFDEFFRGNQARKHAAGTGLGLAIVKQIVERDKGKIWCESKVGKGTSMLFTVPLA